MIENIEKTRILDITYIEDNAFNTFVQVSVRLPIIKGEKLKLGECKIIQ